MTYADHFSPVLRSLLLVGAAAALALAAGCSGGDIAGLTAKPSDAMTARIAAGEGTFLLAIDALGPDANYTGLAASLLPALGELAAAGGFVPTSDATWNAGTYTWHPLSPYLAQQSPPVALSPIANSYMVDNLLVFGPAASLTLSVNWAASSWSSSCSALC